MIAINERVTANGKPGTVERLLGGGDCLVRFDDGSRYAVEARDVASAPSAKGAPLGIVTKAGPPAARANLTRKPLVQEPRERQTDMIDQGRSNPADDPG